jgi:hypothetical protein
MNAIERVIALFDEVRELRKQLGEETALREKLQRDNEYLIAKEQAAQAARVARLPGSGLMNE